MKYIVAIDLGGMSAKGALFTDCGELICKEKRKTYACDGFDCTMQNLAELAFSLAKKGGVSFDDVVKIGVGAPGVVDSANGVILRWTNFAWSNVPFSKRLYDLTGKPVKVANDANVAALGEAKFGATAQYQSSILLTLGTGIGGGTIQKVDEQVKYAAVILTILPILVVYPFLQKYFTKGVLLGSVKE